MRAVKRLVAAVSGLMLLAVPFAFADALSVSIQSLSPLGAIPVGTTVSFTITPTGFSPSLYILSDPFGTSTASNSNISGNGAFSWTPVQSDIGTHPLIVTASDNVGNAASTTVSIVVAPPPSLVIQSLSPGPTVMIGAKLSFTATVSRLTNPSFSLHDAFGGTSGSSILNTNIDASGNFSWTPDVTQQGEHVLTVYATDSVGRSVSASQTVRVGAEPSLTIQLLAPAGNITPGQTVTFRAGAQGYWPTTFSIGDAFTGTASSITNNNINASGLFSWTPLAGDFGTHVLRIIGTVGAWGQSASTTQTIVVLGPGGVVPPPIVPASTSATSASSTSVASSTSGTASSTASSALMDQLAKLQAQIAGLSTSANSTPSSGYVFSGNLRQGQTGDVVLQLQTVLATQGFLAATPNGHFGPATTAAVKKFQAAHGLSPVGTVGPATRAALNALASSSSGTANVSEGAATTAGDAYVFKNFIGLRDSGTDVLELQKRLATLGFFSGSATGYFGTVTETAVKKFQTAKGINAAGYVGPATRAALNQ
ncbi:MAG: peptidoglycan-binding protein [bacterium]|nr:peptidoglycan-binding protein [bacterium]